MPSPLPALRRERVKLYLRILAVSAAIGAAYGLVLALDGRSPLLNIAIGVANSVLIAGSIAAIEIFLLREGSSMKRLLRLPFIAVVALKTLVYASIVVAVIAGAARSVALLFPGRLQAAPLDPTTELVTIGLSLATTVIFVIVLQAAGVVGRRTFRNLIFGRYRQPRAERRFFLFVDVIGSTAIAERLGPLQAHRFLAAVFSATAEPVAASRGEIYQYVGDEIVVTWTEAEGIPEGRPLRCFFLMEESLNELKANFRERFSAEPGLRAALHLGEVIAGEVGEVRRAIVYHGDVMNTASRLEQATRDLGCRFIASDDAVQALGPQKDMIFKDLGSLTLRGRKEPIRAWAVDS
jgi:adenylate cyclase